MKKFLAFTIFILAITFLSSCSKAPVNKNSYKIAVIAPLSGPYKDLGRSIVRGSELAVSEFNEAGGIDGRKIELVKEDDGGLVGEGAFFAYRLTRTDKVLGVIGHLNSDISIPASEFYRRAKIPQISPGSTSPYFTEREATKGYVFRTIGRDDTQGQIAADYVYGKGLMNVAILYNDRSYGQSLAGEFAKALKSFPNNPSKPEIVFFNMIEVGRDDYGALLSRVSSTKPDAIFLAGEHYDAGNLVKDFNKYGLSNVQFIGGDGIDHSEFIRVGGKGSEGTVIVSSAPIQDKNFVKKYIQHFEEEPTGYSANSYDATKILLNAINIVKDEAPELIAKEIANTKNFKGVTGDITFNDKGDLTSKGFVLTKVVNGKFEVFKNDL